MGEDVSTSKWQWVKKSKPAVVVGLVIVSVLGIVSWAGRSPINEFQVAGSVSRDSEFEKSVKQINNYFESTWQANDLMPAEPADDLQIIRRLALSLHGTIPSLQEIREYSKDKRSDRIEQWTASMLADKRFADYFAERLSRAFVGVDNSPFLIFRRDRFVGWLTEQLKKQTPYNKIVQEMIASKGLWTGVPSTNYMTATYANEDFDKNKIAGRSVRVFLGLRIDCAQCHDHPFQDWQQSQFEGLAAHFGQLKISPVGVEDKRYLHSSNEKTANVVSTLDRKTISDEIRKWFDNDGKQQRQKLTTAKLTVIETGQQWQIDGEDGIPLWFIRAANDRLNVYHWDAVYVIEDHETLDKRVVFPAVPFHPEWVPDQGSNREKLAAWITHKENDWFERAIVNRVWGLMFGVPFFAPVDDLPFYADKTVGSDENASAEQNRDREKYKLLDLLADDFRQNGYDLQRLIQLIARSKPFRLQSSHSTDDLQQLETLKEHWAIFPMTRLRPEQFVGSILQAASVKTIDQNTHLLFRLIKFGQMQNFVRDYGDLGENELDGGTGTIPQALLRMNGSLAKGLTKTEDLGAIVNSAFQIVQVSSSNEKCLETCYLVCLARGPTVEESQYFLAQMENAANPRQRKRVVSDIFWSLFNSPEFSWNH